MRGFDGLVVGAGIAGAALAWQWRFRGRRVLLMDRGDAASASRIAAGLITPITGKRLVLDPEFDSLLAAAHQFYSAVEQTTGTTLLLRCGAVRLFQHDAEMGNYQQKQSATLAGRTMPAQVDRAALHAENGGFAMPDAARLDVPAFLAATQAAFEREGAWLAADFPQHDPGIRPAVLATGIAAFRDATIPPRQFQPAKGEILTVRVPGFEEPRVLHRGIWMARIAPELYRVGATYSWDRLDDQPTPHGRAELEARLQKLLKIPFEVVGHDAAARPISRTRQPIAEMLATGVWVFNGLGSKGALLAPAHAARLLDAIEAGERLGNVPARPWRQTEIVHQLLASHLQPGDLAIDATAGNGHDTLHLARLVGPQGRVFAFDIQPQALEAAANRLRQAGAAFNNVQLIPANHAEMARLIPAELHGLVAAIVFNLGYLPGGDHRIITQPANTFAALQAAKTLLRPGGLLTVIAYLGHPGGAEDDRAVQQTLGVEPLVPNKANAPKLYVWRK